MLRYYEKKADAIIEEIKCIKFYNKNASSYKILIMYVCFFYFICFLSWMLNEESFIRKLNKSYVYINAACPTVAVIAILYVWHFFFAWVPLSTCI